MTRYIDLLERDELRAAGIPDPWHLGRADRVRFHELDALNHVNNATYLTWFETFRVAYLIRNRIGYFGPAAPVIVLKTARIDYRRPLLVDEDYVVTGRTTSLRQTSFVMDYAVFTAGEIAASGDALLVLFEADGETRRPLSDEIRRRMIEEDGATAG